jgi:hypothetical protein
MARHKTRPLEWQRNSWIQMEGALALIGFPARRSLVRFLKPLELRVPAKTLQPPNSNALENRVNRGGRIIARGKNEPINDPHQHDIFGEDG